MFTESDLNQIKQKGNTKQEILAQIETIKKGFPFMQITKPAIKGAGIVKLDEDEVERYLNIYEVAKKDNKILKFVPASGAASRMFKDLFAYLNSNNPEEPDGDLFESKHKAVVSIMENIKRLALFPDLCKLADIEKLIKEKRFPKIAELILTEVGLNYGSLPKGLLKFHNYENSNRTPVEEHLVEAAEYASSNGVSELHFTVSPEHQAPFEKHIAMVKKQYETKYDIKYKVSFSVQKKSTDTIAVDLENNPFRNQDGSLLFRPGGHGALIENLNEFTDDIIFIKNIDNVVPDALKGKTVEFKKVFGGILVEIRDQIYSYAEKIESDNISEELINEILNFLEKKLSTIPAREVLKSTDAKISYIKEKLNRPIRICGMVANIGETGGGPFWAKNRDNSESPQVVETSQINLEDSATKEIFSNSTHFNPVDIACTIKDYKGEKFDLTKFIDPQTGFISLKSKDGKELKALELPGLWNGAMSDWNSVFVEVPVITFNPVKTLNDLLRPEHQ